MENKRWYPIAWLMLAWLARLLSCVKCRTARFICYISYLISYISYALVYSSKPKGMVSRAIRHLFNVRAPMVSWGKLGAHGPAYPQAHYLGSVQDQDRIRSGTAGLKDDNMTC